MVERCREMEVFAKPEILVIGSIIDSLTEIQKYCTKEILEGLTDYLN